MKPPTRWIRRAFRFLFAIAVSYGVSLFPFQPSLAQQAPIITVENQATGSFERSPTRIEPLTSNPTEFTIQPEQPALEVIKTGDRTAAEPGDVVIYRVLVRNVGTATINPLVLQDQLPLGFNLIVDSVQISQSEGDRSRSVEVQDISASDRSITLSLPALEPNQTLNILYAAVLTPDALRGTGQNLAQASGTGGGRRITSNTSSHRIEIRSGIITDCGTILGRVFIDHNEDGEQQPGEPGVPNAVIFLDDGNRIITDIDGLFSLANVVAGQRVGTLDLSSIPGYAIASNRYRIEDNSPSRLVRLQPGGLARMNFAVTPLSNPIP